MSGGIKTLKDMTITTVREAKKHNPASKYEKYRIPGMVFTKNDVMLICFEARSAGGDWSPMDIVLLRSVDYGKTFSAEIILAAGFSEGKCVNNPVLIVGNDNTVYFLHCVEYAVAERGGGVFLRKSVDDGLTWSEPEDITACTNPAYRNAFALGPGHGICLADGTLLVPVWMVPKSAGASLTSHSPTEVYVFFSRDHGQSWQLTEKIEQGKIVSPNETTAAITSDGRVMLNHRICNKRMRAVSYSDTGVSDYSPMKTDRRLMDPHCFGSSAALDVAEHPYTILFVNCRHRLMRCNLTLYGSVSDGESFEFAVTVEKNEAAYADVAIDSGGRIYVLYETDGYTKANLAVFDYDNLR